MIKRGQISTEYLIIISFVMFVIITVVGIGVIYGAEIQETIRFSQLERFAHQTIDAAESVQYGGEPSRATVNAYLPSGIKEIQIIGKEIFFNVTTQHGDSRIAYPSAVEMTGIIDKNSGIKKLLIVAGPNAVSIISS